MERLIAIDGRGGSGKTYLSEQLAERLGAKVYHLDDYGDDYQPFIGIPKLIEALEQTDAPIVIFEGIGVFDERFDQFQPYRIFVGTPEVVRSQRATDRDIPRPGRSAEDWRNIWAIWSKVESEYFTQARIDKASCIVGAEDGNFDIDAIVSELS